MNDESRRVPVCVVDAFADEPLAGNPAGVVFDAESLDENQRQAIANELAVSETAFLEPADDADFRIQFFTPQQEVDLCGHATIGSLVAALETGRLTPGEALLETNVGELDVELEPDWTVWLDVDPPAIRSVDLEYDRVADTLGVNVAALEGMAADLPLAVASVGVDFLVVPISYLQDVARADPNPADVEELTESVDADGIHLITFDTLDPKSTVHGRVFAPGIGVPEDPVTGTACGSTAAYLVRYDAFQRTDPTRIGAEAGERDTGLGVAIDDGDPTRLQFEQGHFVDRPGKVQVIVDGTVRIGGRAVVSMTGELWVPDDEDDEIIESG